MMTNLLTMHPTNILYQYDLNYFKQFQKQIVICDKDIYRINDPLINKNDHGSKDHGLVYIEFNAAMFQALKSNMMKIAKEKYQVSLAVDPKVELYGQAEERMLLDLNVHIKGHDHAVKMKVYNTACAMDFQALKHDIGKIFNHLDEYFVRNVLLDIISTLKKKIDLVKLNDFLRKLATEGKNNSKKSVLQIGLL